MICDIKEDKTALMEILRILKPEAKLYCRSLLQKYLKLIEYPKVYTKEEREVAYGYGYHERIYNDKEYVKLLTSVGFVVEIYNISARYNKNGLNPLEDLYICKKK